jgi:rhodanese-related sulfurtransferase
VDASGKPTLTILDLRTERHLEPGQEFPSIKTSCRTLELLLDELQRPEIRDKVPKDGLVVTVTETGNRDIFAMKFMYKYGYTNIVGLNFGMRGWIKPGYPAGINE